MKRSAGADSRVLLGALLVGGGVVLLGFRFFGRGADLLWPFFIVVPGLMLATSATFSQWRSRSMAIAGSVVTAIGLILLAQSVFDYYQSWAYAWTLLPLAGGVGSVLYGYQHGDQTAIDDGRNTIRWTAVAFIVFAAAFELLIFGDRYHTAGIVMPIVLIGVGGLLLLRGRGGSDAVGGQTEATASRQMDDLPDSRKP